MVEQPDSVEKIQKHPGLYYKHSFNIFENTHAHGNGAKQHTHIHT